MTQQVVLFIKESDKRYMQGKTIVTFDNCWFLHRARSNQWHYQTNSPCGIDVTVLRWLADNGIDEIHFHDQTRKMLYCTTIQAMREHGVIMTSRGTTRCFLTDRYWAAYPLIENKLPYDEPHIREVVELEPYSKPSGRTSKKVEHEPDLPKLQPKLL